MKAYAMQVKESNRNALQGEVLERKKIDAEIASKVKSKQQVTQEVSKVPSLAGDQSSNGGFGFVMEASDQGDQGLPGMGDQALPSIQESPEKSDDGQHRGLIRNKDKLQLEDLTDRLVKLLTSIEDEMAQRETNMDGLKAKIEEDIRKENT